MSEKIEKLTAEQEARLPEFVEKWTQIGLCTGPADRPRAEKAVREIYARAGLAGPAKIVWCGSPLSLGLTRAIIDRRSGEIVPRASEFISEGVWASVGASVEDSGDTVAGYCFKTHIDKVLTKVLNDIQARVSPTVWRAVAAEVADNVWDNVADVVSIWDSINAVVAKGVWDREGLRIGWGDSFDAQIDGQHATRLLAQYRYFHDVLGLTAETEKLSGHWELAQSAGPVLPHQNICWISERRHILACDDDGLLHSLAGPACAYPDGFAIHAIHGVRVPAFVVGRPHEITVAKIDDEENAEVRRVMIERYRLGEEICGAAAYMRDGGGERLDSDEKFGTLWRRDLPDDEPIIMLEVVNATRELDGTFKHYWLRVPPHITTAREAAAWTFDQSPEDYRPIIET